jgi:hypothetical protein
MSLPASAPVISDQPEAAAPLAIISSISLAPNPSRASSARVC